MAEDVKKRFLDLGADVIGSDPAQLAASIRAGILKWTKVSQSAGLKPN